MSEERNALVNKFVELTGKEDISAFIISAIATQNGQKQIITSIKGSEKYINIMFDDITKNISGLK